MAKRPFMPLFCEDFLSAVRSAGLTPEEIGTYTILLTTMWVKGAKLPNNAERLARIAGLTAHRFGKIWANLQQFFYIDEAGDLRQARMMEEWENADRVSAARSAAVGQRADRKAKSSPANGDLFAENLEKNCEVAKPIFEAIPLKTLEPSSTIDDNSSQFTEEEERISDSPVFSNEKTYESARPTLRVVEGGAGGVDRCPGDERTCYVGGEEPHFRCGTSACGREKAAPTPDAVAWSRGVAVLTGQGRMTEPAARRFFGRLLGQHHLAAHRLLAPIGECEASGTHDPQGYLTASAKARGKAAAEAEPRKYGRQPDGSYIHADGTVARNY